MLLVKYMYQRFIFQQNFYNKNVGALMIIILNQYVLQRILKFKKSYLKKIQPYTCISVCVCACIRSCVCYCGNKCLWVKISEINQELDDVLPSAWCRLFWSVPAILPCSTLECLALVRYSEILQNTTCHLLSWSV